MTSRAPALPPDERRAAIIEAALPLLLEQGANVSTRKIAETARVAEGTIFGVFADKDALLDAVLQAALDPAPTERALSAIDTSLPLEEKLVEAVRIMQLRQHKIGSLLSSIGDQRLRRTPPAQFAALASMLGAESAGLRVDAATAARQLRALTLAVSHPALIGGEPMTPRDIVSLFLDGIRARSAGEERDR
jgi:AcrR family transcriptional regulator